MIFFVVFVEMRQMKDDISRLHLDPLRGFLEMDGTWLVSGVTGAEPVLVAAAFLSEKSTLRFLHPANQN